MYEIISFSNSLNRESDGIRYVTIQLNITAYCNVFVFIDTVRL